MEYLDHLRDIVEDRTDWNVDEELAMLDRLERELRGAALTVAAVVRAAGGRVQVSARDWALVETGLLEREDVRGDTVLRYRKVDADA